LVVETLIRGNSLSAELIRRSDWAATSLGAVELWSETLLGSVNMVLAAPIPMQLFWGPDFICIYNDAVMPTLSGKHPGAMGRPAREVWREAWARIGPQMEQVLAHGQAVSCLNALVPILRDGVLEDRYWTYSYSPTFDGTGNVVGVLDIAQDTTDVLLAERAVEARRASEQRLADYTVATNDVLYEMSSDWTVMSQLDGQSFLADTRTADPHWLQKYIHPLDQPRVLAEINRAVSTKTKFELEHRVLQVDGSLGWTLSRAVPRLDEHAELVHWIGAARDITHRKSAEQALLQTEKLAAVGRLASSIAHEINNPLEAVTNLLYLARRAPEPEVLDAYLEGAERELRRVAAITNQTLRFHKQSTKPSQISCSALFLETLQLHEARLLNAHIQVQQQERAKQSPMCFEGEIRQVLSNLIGNAIDAMPRGGRLVLRTREATNWSTGTKGLVMTFADTGTGMSNSVRNRIFEAFFSTKGTAGTGLGLWVSKELVERHGGTLTVRSSTHPDRHGTAFVLFLPFELLGTPRL
jgi:signal transduction histidine kinase